jgi:hypothetical protein
LNEAPFTPAAFDPLFREGDIWVVGQGFTDHLIVVFGRAGIKVDRNVIPNRGELLGLLHNRLGVLVAQENEGDFCHIGNKTLRSN